VREHLVPEYKEQGVDLKFNTNIAKMEKVDGGIKVTYEDGSTQETDVVMYATGRVPRTKVCAVTRWSQAQLYSRWQDTTSAWRGPGVHVACSPCSGRDACGWPCILLMSPCT
jgi:hypothetical protein